MLKKIIIENYVLIEKSIIEFGENLNVISGETGSGKSILLNALNSTFGKHGFGSQIKPGKKSIKVSSIFDISSNQMAREYLNQLNIELSDELTLTREIPLNENNTLCFINNTRCNVNDLKKISKTLIDIHSQHNNQYLFSQKYHITLLDNYTEHRELLERYQNVFKKYQEKLDYLKIALEDQEKLKEQKDYLLFTLNDLEKTLIDVDEYAESQKELEELEINQNIFKKQNTLLTSITSIDNLLETSTNNLIELAELKSSHYQSILDSINEVKENITTIKNELYQDKLSPISDTQIDSYHEKLSKIEQLKKKYHKNLDELHQMKNDIQKKLEIIENPLDNEKLKKEVDILKEETTTIAQEIHSNRIASSKILSQKINELFKDLAMEKAELFINIQINKDSNNETILSSNGFDQVDFLYKPTPTQSFKKLSSIASGGEISRISLAIKYILSHLIPNHCIIFDEIDTGVGGKTALNLGKTLSNFAKKRQVIVITHLAQIAKYSNHHFYVYKENKDNDVISHVKKLNNEEKIYEIARMLFGNKEEKNKLSIAKDFINN